MPWYEQGITQSARRHARRLHSDLRQEIFRKGQPMKAYALLAAVVLLLTAGGMVYAGHRQDDAGATGAPHVELYITSWCGYSKKAVAFFQSRGIPCSIYDIDKDKAAALRKKELDKDDGVPFAIINGKKIHGYKEKKYKKALHIQ